MRLKTEVGDQLQYLTHEFNDSTIRFVVKYAGVIDAKRLQKAMQILIEGIDILHSTFVVGTWGTKWITNQSYSLKDAMTINKISGDVFAAAKKAALKPVAYSNSVQIRCDLFCNQSESAIAFLVGHMCADGRDAVYLLEKLVEIYNQISLKKTEEKVELKNGSRLLDQCYWTKPDMLSFKLNKVVKDKVKEISSRYEYGTKESGKPCMVEHIISREVISNIKHKMSHATVNDIILIFLMELDVLLRKHFKR